ncbi:MAG: hypothetical protein KJ011_10815 [Burkholderiaceae bacterium]|nr:hypothetical protein [Burkholderiaceae bacterium]
MRFSGLVLAGSLSLNCAAAFADGGAATIYGGHRAGGGFTDAFTGRPIDVAGAGAIAASLDFAIDAHRQIQLFVSHQRSRFDVGRPATASLASLDGRSASISYFHVGGTNFLLGPIGTGPYVAGGIGATRLAPGQSGFSNEWRPSMSLALGYQWPFGAHVALRAEVRGYLTLVKSGGSLFCSGGCTVSIEGDSFTQGEALVGLSVRF